MHLPPQVLLVMKSRESHIAAMLSLFQERAVLCRQAADLAVKAATTNKFAPPGGPPGSLQGPADDGSMLWVLMKYGYMYCAHNMVALHRILELLKVRAGAGGGREGLAGISIGRNGEWTAACAPN